MRALDIDLLPVVAAPLSTKIASTVDSVRVQRLCDLFCSVYPRKGLRHGFYLALTGFCYKQQLPAAECKSLVIALCSQNEAADKIPERLKLVDLTYSKNTPVGGETKLQEILVDSVGDGGKAVILAAAKIILGSTPKEEKEVVPTRSRRKHDPNHVYQEDILAASGERVATAPNTLVQVLYSHEAWAGVWQYDTFADRYVAVDPPSPLDAESNGLSKDDIFEVQLWFQSIGYKANFEDTERAIRNVCKRRPFHPVKEYLLDCKPKHGAIEQIARTVLGTQDPLQIRELRCFMLGAVRRAITTDPNGVQVDTALVLQGGQGKGKTSFCRRLFCGWVLEDMRALDSKESIRQLRGKWCVELSELDKILRAESETVKAFITRKRDTLDEKYERERQVPRRCVFMGTTNRSDFLRDETGDRRWWVIPVGRIRLENLSLELIAEAWGEAYEAVMANENHWLTEEEELQLKEQQEDFRLVDPLELPIENFLAGKTEFSFDDVLRHVRMHDYAVNAEKGAAGPRISKIIISLGCYKIRKNNVRLWAVPDKLTSKQPPQTKAVAGLTKKS